MASTEDMSQMLKIFAKIESLYHHMYEDIIITKLSTQGQEASMEAQLKVKEKWANAVGLMSFGDLHSLFDIISVPFLMYINKPITTSINLNVNRIRLPKVGELMKFSIFCKNVNQKVIVVWTFVYDENGNLIASGNHNLKSLKKFPVAREKI
jgi:acyl-coenzyme A thioesterase PaaI-like protein